MSEEQLPCATPAADCWGSKQAESPGATESQSGSVRGGSFASFGALLSAFIASSWCWLPLLLILGGISGAGITTFLEHYRPLFMVVTFGFLGSAFYLTYRPRRVSTSASEGGAEFAKSAGRSKIMAFNKVMLWVVTAIAIAFLFFPQAFTSVTAPGDGFTTDMQRAVIQIEGMTWHTWGPKAKKALESAPGVLAVKVDFKTKQAMIGVSPGTIVPQDEIIAALEEIGYRGEFVEKPQQK